MKSDQCYSDALLGRDGAAAVRGEELWGHASAAAAHWGERGGVLRGRGVLPDAVLYAWGAGVSDFDILWERAVGGGVQWVDFVWGVSD